MINLNKELKILYVHGFNGHPNGSSAQQLRKALENRNIAAVVDAPAIPFMEPSNAIKFIESQNNYDLIVASSLGAFYSLSNTKICKILVNIAMPEDLLKVDPNIDINYIQKLNEIENSYYKNAVFFKNKYHTYFLFGDSDKIAQNKEFIIQECKCFDNKNIITVNMDHHLDEFGVNKVCDIILQMSLCGNRNLQTYDELPVFED